MSGAGASRPPSRGAEAEDLAAALLVAAGFRIVARNWRRPEGELDQQTLPSPEGGLAWEVKRLLALDDYQKVILIMPGVDEAHARRIWGQYRVISRGRLPPYGGGEIAATFSADGTCRVVRVARSGTFSKSYRRKWEAYQAAITVEH